jgi:F-type H+-transporting ATPase subunit b
MRRDFGLNTNLFETNVLNLLVVFWVVVTVVGDAFRTSLNERRQAILSTLQEADQKIIEAQELLEKSRKSVETARSRAQEIRAQAIKTAEQERSAIQEQLKNDLQRLIERGRQTIYLERQRAVQSIAQKVARLALIAAENTLLKDLGPKGLSSSKQKELNEIHVSETFVQLKGFSA